MRPMEQHDDPGVPPSPFRAAFGRARHEALAATAPPPSAPELELGPPDWEFRLVERSGKRKHEQERWNALGRQGWELVGITGRHAAFKRPL